MRKPSTRTRRQAGRLADAIGKLCEQMAERNLIKQGALVQRIATPCKVIGGRKFFTAKVVGDLVGVMPNGKALLVECKCHVDGRPPCPSDFLPHQRETLKRWCEMGGVALVAWLGEHRELCLCSAMEILNQNKPIRLEVMP